jgi:hypothetical protein
VKEGERWLVLLGGEMDVRHQSALLLTAMVERDLRNFLQPLYQRRDSRGLPKPWWVLLQKGGRVSKSQSCLRGGEVGFYGVRMLVEVEESAFPGRKHGEKAKVCSDMGIGGGQEPKRWAVRRKW